MNNIIVSIIIPFYNVEKYLKQCIDSVIVGANNIFQKEIILVNDGSNDQSFQIAQAYQSTYPDFITIINKENGGLSSARNTGLEVSNGKYILFIDSDDVIEVGAIELMILKAEESNADIVVADYYEFFDENIQEKNYRYDKSLIEKNLIEEKDRMNKLFNIDVSFTACNKLHRKSFLDSFNLKFKEGYLFEDLEFTFREFYYASKIVKLDKCFYGYRQRKFSIMSTIKESSYDKMSVMKEHKKFLENEGKFNIYKEGYKILYFKMFLSLVYSVITLRDTNIKIADMLLDKLLIDDYLKSEILNKKLFNLNNLKLKEKLFYFGLKYGIINKKTLTILSKII